MRRRYCLPASVVRASSLSKHHRRLGSMGKTIRRLSDAREASVRPMYVSVSFLFIAYFLSLFWLCWCTFLRFPFMFIVFFFLFGLLLSFLSLLVPPFPFKNVLHSTLVPSLAIVPPFPQQFLTFWRLFEFRSFILSDSPLCYQIRHDLLALQTNLPVC
jgi:hypothetical protein